VLAQVQLGVLEVLVLLHQFLVHLLLMRAAAVVVFCTLAEQAAVLAVLAVAVLEILRGLVQVEQLTRVVVAVDLVIMQGGRLVALGVLA
jgi:hypothetical protein